jgi:hypothetical protein
VLAVSERAVSTRIDDIAALLLPLYGFIGAAAFVFRRLMQKIQTAELDATELRQAIIRLALGTILGGVIGLFFGADGAALAGKEKRNQWGTTLVPHTPCTTPAAPAGCAGLARRGRRDRP